LFGCGFVFWSKKNGGKEVGFPPRGGARRVGLRGGWQKKKTKSAIYVGQTVRMGKPGKGNVLGTKVKHGVKKWDFGGFEKGV